MSRIQRKAAFYLAKGCGGLTVMGCGARWIVACLIACPVFVSAAAWTRSGLASDAVARQVAGEAESAARIGQLVHDLGADEFAARAGDAFADQPGHRRP